MKSSRSGAVLYIFEDNEAVIKMIIKGRSPTTRHVSRTHRVALDWLFDRINLNPKIQSKHVDTNNQLADILTKGNFTRDEWNHLLRLFNSVISALLGVLERCRKEFKKEQEKKESWQSQDRRRTLLRRLQQAVPQRRVRVHRAARGYSKASSQSLSIVARAGRPAAED